MKRFGAALLPLGVLVWIVLRCDHSLAKKHVGTEPSDAQNQPSNRPVFDARVKSAHLQFIAILNGRSERSNKEKGATEARLAGALRALQAIDLSQCPKDYQSAWTALEAAFLHFNEALAKADSAEISRTARVYYDSERALRQVAARYGAYAWPENK